MQMKLSYKLFGAFFLILAIVVGAFWISRLIFSMNFERYFHQMELERAQRLVPVLQDEYLSRHGWQALEKDPARWRRLTYISPEMDNRLPPDQAPAPPSEPRPGDKPPGSPPLRLFLLDADQQPIIGHPDKTFDATELMVLKVDGRIVGWLGLLRPLPFSSGPPADLLQRQARQLFFLGCIVIALTALIAYLLSRHLLKPIGHLDKGTEELARRNFTIRIKATTRDELGRLANHFNTMAETLERYEKMRHQWVTDISHELRTPLAVLRAEIEALIDGIRPTTQENILSLHAEVLRLGKLVEDLHLLAKADSDHLLWQQQCINPIQILRTTVERFQPRLDQCGIVPTLDVDRLQGLPIMGDGHRLEQVFTNILDNACKYVQAPGALTIRGEKREQGMTIYFHDSGPGVSQEALPRLFDRLFRVDPSRSRATGGSGLGLSICKQIVENHGGDISADTNTNGGLTICIRLPETSGEMPADNRKDGGEQ